jgi:hypothetical protein
VTRSLPQLSRVQAVVLALWSLGMVSACSCGLSQVSTLLCLAAEPSAGEPVPGVAWHAAAVRGVPHREPGEAGQSGRFTQALRDFGVPAAFVS